jgi:hypothetical protein
MEKKVEIHMIVHKEGVWLSLKCIDENLKES